MVPRITKFTRIFTLVFISFACHRSYTKLEKVESDSRYDIELFVTSSIGTHFPLQIID